MYKPITTFIHNIISASGEEFSINDISFIKPLLTFFQNQYKEDMKKHVKLMEKASRTNSEYDIKKALENTKYINEKYRSIEKNICHPADLVHY